MEVIIFNKNIHFNTIVLRQNFIVVISTFNDF